MKREELTPDQVTVLGLAYNGKDGVVSNVLSRVFDTKTPAIVRSLEEKALVYLECGPLDWVLHLTEAGRCLYATGDSSPQYTSEDVREFLESAGVPGEQLKIAEEAFGFFNSHSLKCGDRAPQVLYSMCSWVETPQGPEYWAGVCDYLRGERNTLPVPPGYIRIGDEDVPAPLQEEPEDGTKVFLLSMPRVTCYFEVAYYSSRGGTTKFYFLNGLAFSNRTDAQRAGEAIIRQLKAEPPKPEWGTMVA